MRPTRLQRRTFRREVFLPCQVVRERDFRLVSSLAFDLSSGGMLALTGDRVLTGEPLLVSFRAPKTGAWFDLAATVARVIHGRRPEDRGRGLGIEFRPLALSTRYDLLDGLEGLPVTASVRA